MQAQQISKIDIPFTGPAQSLNRLMSKLFLRGCTIIAKLFNHEFEIQRSVLKLAVSSK